MRMYEGEWIKLRKSTTLANPGIVKIAAPARFHARIYKAITKEKDLDNVYKMQLAENFQAGRLGYKSIGGYLEITMRLRKFVRLRDAFV